MSAAQDHIAAIRAALDSGAASVDQAVGAYYEQIIGIQPQSGAPVPVLVRPQDLRSILAYIGELEGQKVELVEALEVLEAYVANNIVTDYPTGIDIEGTAFQRARAAIAKATGSAE